MEQPIIITDDNFLHVRKLVNKQYYQTHTSEIIEKSLQYYENNKDVIRKKCQEKYREIQHDKIQERYNKSKDKYLSTLLKCSLCSKEKDMLLLYCNECVINKFGTNIKL